MALLLLRATLGATAAAHGGMFLWEREANAATWNGKIGAGALVVAGASLLIGFMTPISATIVSLAGLVTAISLFLTTGDNPFQSLSLAVYVFVTATAVALLGPGAFSLDARFFGRREIIIPGKLNKPKDL